MAAPTDPLYAQQWHFGLIGDIARIWDEYRGSGVSVAVYDDGLEYDHPDLAANYDASMHFRYNGVTYDPMPKAGADTHGTSCAGLIGAVANNGRGGTGVASEVTLTGVNYLNDIQTLSRPIVDAMFRWAANFDVMSNSWGRTPDYQASQSLAVDTATSDSAATNVQFAYIAANGRDGLGTINVQAAGNSTLNANGSGLNASRYTITVAATEKDGMVASYSNYGVSILLAAPASAVTTDRTGEDGRNNSTDDDPLPVDYRNSMDGTSAATPTVAGVVALMLDANAGLGWRDVSSILGFSARHAGSSYDAAPASVEQGAWGSIAGTQWNGGGAAYHLSYGFGMLDAYAAVRMAEVWTTMRGGAAVSANEKVATASNNQTYSIPDAGYDWNFNLIVGERALGFNITQDVEIETVYVTVDITHGRGYDLTLALRMPDGTEIPLMANEDAQLTPTQTGMKWTFGVEALRGVSSLGNWQVVVRDNLVDYSGVIKNVKLEFFGAQNTADDIYTFTGDFLTLRGLQQDRSTIADTNGGTDWVNMASIAGAIATDLRAGGATRVDGASWFTVATGADVFENVVTGDGNDRIVGNTLNNRLLGMRGNDALSGLGGNDTLDGGTGRDTLDGGAGNDTYVLGRESDTIRDTAGIDTITTTITRSLAGYTTIENLKLLGSAAINGTGNALANILTGNSGNNVLNGGTGKDALVGGAGNDTYVLGSERDTVSDGVGIDTITSTIARSLASYASIENLTLLGAAGIAGSGNGLANTIRGNAGGNVLNGGLGNDTLVGGAGKDTFVFNTKLNPTANLDRITDFKAVDDLVHLENAIFRTLTATGKLAASLFEANGSGKALDTKDRILYETDTGKLFYDADGSGNGTAIQFATLTTKPGISYVDFFVV